GLENLLVGGDFWDWGSLSRKHPQDLPTVSAEATLEVGGKLLALLLNRFKRVAICEGNHDSRFSRALSEPVSLRRTLFMALEDRQYSGELITTSLEWVEIGDLWIAGHPRWYGKNPGKLAQIATKRQRNLLASHTHLQSTQVSDCGKFV